MGKFTLYIGPAGPYYYFEKQIRRQSIPDTYIYILPVNRAVRYLKKRLIVKSPKGVLIDPPIFTFNTLLRHIYNSSPDRNKIVNNTMRLIFLREVLNKNMDNLSLLHNNRISDKGVLKKIDQMLIEFCQFGYNPTDFNTPPLSSGEVYYDFGRILSGLYQSYERQLLDETALILDVIKNLNKNSFHRLFPDTQVIYLNGYGIFTPPMINFLKIIKQWCDLFIKIDYVPDNKTLFRHTYTGYDSLQKFADKTIEIKDGNDIFSTYLFSTECPEANTGKIKCNIKIQKAKNRREEISFIASKIKYYYHRNNIPLHEIGITFPDIESYFFTILSIFREYDIPYNISTGFSLSHSPLIKTYLQIIKTILSNFKVEEVYQLLLSPFMNQDYRVDITIFQKLTRLLRLRYFDSKWSERVDELIQMHNGYSLNEYFSSEKLSKTEVEKTKAILQALFSIMLSLKKELSPQEFHTSYLSVLQKLGALDWYRKGNDHMDTKEKEKEFRAFNKFIKVLNQLIWSLSFLYKERKFTLDELYEFLVLVIENSNYNLREWSNSGVQIMPRLEIQSVECKILFIGGLIEGEFPRKVIRNIFFNDEECETMGLYTREDIYAQDCFLFYQLLSSKTEQLILTYPEMCGDSRLLPSTFLSALGDIYCLKEISNDEQPTYLPSKYKIKEDIVLHLVNDLNPDYIKNLENVIQLIGHKEFSIWFDNINILLKKKSRLKISAHEGNLTNNSLIKIMLEDKFKNKYFSITELETYAFCPMKYFLKYILHLDVEEEIYDVITPLEKGRLLHKILFLFYSNLKQMGVEKNPSNYYDLLLEIAQREFDQLPYNGLRWRIEKEKYFGNELDRGLFKVFLDLEQAEIEQKGYVPCHFEVAFGSGQDLKNYDRISSRKPFVVQDKGGKKRKLTGKIDRIDIDMKGHFIVYDYKIGMLAERIKIKDVFEGNSLQLPVYIAAVDELFRDLHKERTAVCGAYYQIKDSEHCLKYPVLIDAIQAPGIASRGDAKLPNKKYTINGKAISFQGMIKKSIDFILDYTESILAGNFQHTKDPTDERCSSYCEFAKICRKDLNKLKAIY